VGSPFVRNHFEDFVHKPKADVIHKNMTSDFYDHNGPGNKPTDAKGDEDRMVGLYKVMPGLRIHIEDMIAEGDKVMCRNVWRLSRRASPFARDLAQDFSSPSPIGESRRRLPSYSGRGRSGSLDAHSGQRPRSSATTPQVLQSTR
jgi:hypothetical protein